MLYPCPGHGVERVGVVTWRGVAHGPGLGEHFALSRACERTRHLRGRALQRH